MKQIFLLLLLITNGFISIAQNDLKPANRAIVEGVVHLTSGEQLTGKILITSLNTMSNSIVYLDKINIKRTLSPEEIKLFKINFAYLTKTGNVVREWKTFESRTVEISNEKQQAFLEKIVDGQITLLRYHDSIQAEFQQRDFLLKANKLVEITNCSDSDLVAPLFKDNTAVYKQFVNSSPSSHKQLKALITTYNSGN